MSEAQTELDNQRAADEELHVGDQVRILRPDGTYSRSTYYLLHLGTNRQYTRIARQPDGHPGAPVQLSALRKVEP